jgi:hypothetical protein
MIFVNTNLAAAAGAILAMVTSWIKFGKPEVGMSLNGALAGLVGITAGCANVTPTSSIIIGAVAGILVVLSVMFFDKAQNRRPGRRHIRPRCLRCLGHPRRRPVQHRRHHRGHHHGAARSASRPALCGPLPQPSLCSNSST